VELSRRTGRGAPALRHRDANPHRGEYQLRWGFTPQWPARQASERTNREGGEIYWGDETAVKQGGHSVRGYAPAGQTPVLAMSAHWTLISMISAITQKGLVRFAFHEGAINSDRFITFLEALIADSGRKGFLIVDNLKVRHSKPVKAWVAELAEKSELVYLPS